MKWSNKGHEFDLIGRKFKVNKKVFIYGAGEYGKYLFNKLLFVNCVEGFIDNDEQKQYVGYLDKSVESIFSFLKRDRKDYIVIIAASKINTKIFLKQLRDAGYIDGTNLFEMDDFIENYLPIYSLYAWNKLFFPSVSFLPSTICNLNCDACLNFTHLNKRQRHREYGQLKLDLQNYFQWVDYTDLFHISGGEPILYPNIIELLDHIGKFYRYKINQLAITTNGTLTLPEKIYSTLKIYNITLIVNDYTDTIGGKAKHNAIIKILKEKDINFHINKVDKWIDLNPIATDNTSMSENQLQGYYNLCNVPYTSLKAGKISSCNYSDYATEAGIIKENLDDYFDLIPYDINKKIELMEFRMGFSKNGYVSLCKQCSGYININKNIVRPAIQLEK